MATRADHASEAIPGTMSVAGFLDTSELLLRVVRIIFVTCNRMRSPKITEGNATREYIINLSLAAEVAAPQTCPNVNINHTNIC